MPLDRRAQRLLDMLAASGPAPAPRPTAAERRLALSALAEMADDPATEAAQTRRLAIPGPAGPLALDLHTPKDLPPASPGLVFFHGGGWVAGGPETHGGFCRRLAAAGRLRVVAVDYRLAPEHPFPAAFDDGAAALRWIAANAAELGIDASRLAVGGDSAGGGLAAAICNHADAPKIALLALVCPILDLAGETESRRAFADGYFLSRRAMEADLDDYCPPGVDRADPRLSPLRAADLSRHPAALIHTAEFDPFRDEGAAYAERLRCAGVSAQATMHPGMIHYFYCLARAIPYGAALADALGAELRAALI